MTKSKVSEDLQRIANAYRTNPALASASKIHDSLNHLPDFKMYDHFKSIQQAAALANQQLFESISSARQTALEMMYAQDDAIQKIHSAHTAGLAQAHTDFISQNESQIAALATDMHRNNFQHLEHLFPISPQQDVFKAINHSKMFSSSLSHAVEIASQFKNFPLEDILQRHRDMAAYQDLIGDVENEGTTLEEVIEEVSSVDAEQKDFLKLSPKVQEALLTFIINAIFAIALAEYAAQGTNIRLDSIDSNITNLREMAVAQALEYRQGFMQVSSTLEDNRSSIQENRRAINTLVRNFSALEAKSICNHRITTKDVLEIKELRSRKSITLGLLHRGHLVYIVDKTDRSWLQVEAEIDGEIVLGWINRTYTKHPHSCR